MYHLYCKSVQPNWPFLGCRQDQEPPESTQAVAAKDLDCPPLVIHCRQLFHGRRLRQRTTRFCPWLRYCQVFSLCLLKCLKRDTTMAGLDLWNSYSEYLHRMKSSWAEEPDTPPGPDQAGGKGIYLVFPCLELATRPLLYTEDEP